MPSLEAHRAGSKCVLDGFLDPAKDDKGDRRDHDSGCAGEYESFHGETPQEIGG